MRTFPHNPWHSDYLQPAYLEELDAPSIRTIVELGCHDGADTLKLQEHFGAVVHAFECHPEAMERARQACAGNPSIHLVEKAAWDADTTIPFYPVIQTTQDGVPVENTNASSCFQARDDYHRLYTQSRIDVRAGRLEDYCRQHQLNRIDLLCMDVQGAALRVLRGWGRHLSRVRFIVVEIEHRPIYRDQDLLPEVDAHLRGFGFRPRIRIERDAWFSDYLYVGIPSWLPGHRWKKVKRFSRECFGHGKTAR
jgi:FkbM family methyltransferase